MKTSTKWSKAQLTRAKVSTYVGMPLYAILSIVIFGISFINISTLWGLAIFGIVLFISCIIGYFYLSRFLKKVEIEMLTEDEEFEKYKKFYEENKDRI